MKALTSRERLKRCFFRQEIDRPGIYFRMGIPRGDKTYDPFRKLVAKKCDLKYAWTASLVPNYKTIITQEPYSDDFEKQIMTMFTPKGKLTKVMLIGLKKQPGLMKKYLLETEHDIEKYLSLPLPTIKGDISFFFKLNKEVGERGIVDVSLGVNPAGVVVDLFGSELFALLSMENREVLHQLMEREMQIKINLVKFLFAEGIGPFFSMLGEEYIVPPMHSPKDFHDFNFRYDKPIIDLIHNNSGRIHIHCHGSVKKVLQDFIEMGIDVLHPLEAPPMGDVLAKEAKAVLKDKVCIEGNVQIADMYEKSREEIGAQVSALIEDAFYDNKGLIVCPTASPYIPNMSEKFFQNCQQMIETVLG